MSCKIFLYVKRRNCLFIYLGLRLILLPKGNKKETKFTSTAIYLLYISFINFFFSIYNDFYLFIDFFRKYLFYNSISVFLGYNTYISSKKLALSLDLLNVNCIPKKMYTSSTYRITLSYMIDMYLIFLRYIFPRSLEQNSETFHSYLSIYLSIYQHIKSVFTNMIYIISRCITHLQVHIYIYIYIYI